MGIKIKTIKTIIRVFFDILEQTIIILSKNKIILIIKMIKPCNKKNPI